jgi:hypothetical protein
MPTTVDYGTIRADSGRLLVMKAWIRAVWFRMGSQPLSWFAVLLVLAGIAWVMFVPLPPSPEVRVRVVGMVLQLSGISSVAVGINDAQKRLGGKPILKRVRGYLAVLFKRPQRHTGFAAIAEGKDTTTADLTVGKRAPDPNTLSIEGRIATLEAESREQRGKLEDTQRLLALEAAARERGDSEVRTTGERSLGELRELLEETQTSGVTLSLAGLVWLVVGTVMTSIPGELAGLL